MKFLLLTTDLYVPGLSNFNRNVIDAKFENYGMNECSCDLVLGGVYHTDFITSLGTDFKVKGNGWVWSTPPPGGACAAYYLTWVDPSSCSGWYSMMTPAFTTIATIAPKFSNPIIPHQVTDLFSCSPSTCPLIVGNGYPSACGGGGTEYRIRNNRINEENKIKVFPNPTSDKLFISQLDGNQKIQIKNIYGEILIEKRISVESFEINISNLPVGVYIVQTENNQSVKFIKLDE